MFTVSVPAASTALTTRDTVKAYLKITTDDDNDFFDGAINSITDQVCNYLGISEAGDGTRHMGLETLVETIRADRYNVGSNQYGGSRFGRRWGRHEGTVVLLPSRYPVVSIGSIVVDDDTLDPSDYEIDGAAGVLRRLSNDVPVDWYGRKIAVTYNAGWLLPNDDGRNLPFDLESTVIDLIKEAWFDRTRDDQIKSEQMLQRTYQYEVFPSDPDLTGGMPAAYASVLDRYRNIHFG